MIIFNTTYHIDDEVHDECILFFKDTYIAQAVSSGFLFEPRLCYIHAQHEEKGSSYSIQFKVMNIHTFEAWMQSEGQALQKELTDRFGKQVAGFVTLLEEVDI